MELKKARRKDFKKIAEIYANEFSKPPYNEPWTLKKARYKIKIFSKYCDIWKIVSRNNIIGFIVINPNQFFPGEIIFGEEMAIKEKFQGKGIGTKAIKRISEIYRRKGFKLFMGINLTKSKATKLYKKLGFKTEKEEVIIYKKLK